MTAIKLKAEKTAKKKAEKKARVPKVRMAMRGGYWQIRYTCPIEKREVRISTKTADEAEAIEQRKKIEAKLRLGIEVTPRRKMTLGASMPWEDFREEYSQLKVSTMRESSQNQTEINIDVCEAIMQPRTLGEMATPGNLATLQAKLLAGAASKKKARSPHTVRSYMATLIAALNWAHRPMHWLPAAVEFDLLEADDPAKGRPITGEEFERMLAAVPETLVGAGQTADPAAVESWRQLLRGIWESGLRLSEALALHWEADNWILPHWTPRTGLLLLHIPAHLQKNRKAQDVPTTPAFAKLLESMPSRKGWIFNPCPRRGKLRLSVAQVGRIISDIGEKALIKVNEAGKPASAHDLRRSFGQRLADAGLPPRDLQVIMRHADFKTTEGYYLKDRAHDQGQRIAAYLGTVAMRQEKKKAARVVVNPSGSRSAGKRS